jgi:hypothetical protein
LITHLNKGDNAIERTIMVSGPTTGPEASQKCKMIGDNEEILKVSDKSTTKRK